MRFVTISMPIQELRDAVKVLNSALGSRADDDEVPLIFGWAELGRYVDAILIGRNIGKVKRLRLPLARRVHISDIVKFTEVNAEKLIELIATKRALNAIENL